MTRLIRRLVCRVFGHKLPDVLLYGDFPVLFCPRCRVIHR